MLCQDLLMKIDRQITRNRFATHGNSSAETSPVSSTRMQRSRPRIEEVSPETPPGVYPSPTREHGFSARGLSFANGHVPPDAVTDTGSEPSWGDEKRW